MAKFMRETAAARALLAYHNFHLAGKLARGILKAASPTATARIAEAIIKEMLQKPQDIYAAVRTQVMVLAAEYVETPAFKGQIASILKVNAVPWGNQIIGEVMRERLKADIQGHITGLVRMNSDDLRAQYRTQVNAEVTRLALEKARSISAAADAEKG